MKIHDSGCDWLTLSFPAGFEKTETVLKKMEQTLQALDAGKNVAKRQNWLGYSGFACYGLFSGIREDGIIVRASGQEAKLAEQICREEKWDARCTRLDLQITANVGKTQTDYGRRVREALTESEGDAKSAKGFNLAFHQARGCDSGAAIGSRSSERFARFYNKTLEQRGRVEPGLWRFEVEFKGQQARLMYKMLMSAASGRWLALSVVKTTFELYGVDMSWVTTAEPFELPSSARENDDERRLRWLKTNVSRTVKELIERGHEQEIRQIFGL